MGHSPRSSGLSAVVIQAGLRHAFRLEVTKVMVPGYGYMAGYMGWWMFASFVFWALVIALGIYLVARLARPTDQQSSAKAILDDRLARGEIDVEEYRSRSTALKV